MVKKMVKNGRNEEKKMMKIMVQMEWKLGEPREIREMEKGNERRNKKMRIS